MSVIMQVGILQPLSFTVLPVHRKLCCNPAASTAARACAAPLTLPEPGQPYSSVTIPNRLPQLIITKIKGNLGVIFPPTPPNKLGYISEGNLPG